MAGHPISHIGMGILWRDGVETTLPTKARDADSRFASFAYRHMTGFTELFLVVGHIHPVDLWQNPSD